MSSVSRPRGRLFQIRGPTAPKLLYPKLLLHHAYVIRGRPEGSSVAFGDEMDVGRHLTAQCLAHPTINECCTETDIINSDRRTVSTVAANCNEWSQLSRRQHYILCQTMQTDRVTDRPDRNRTVETELLEPVSIRLNRIRPLYAEAI